MILLTFSHLMECSLSVIATTLRDSDYDVANKEHLISSH